MRFLCFRLYFIFVQMRFFAFAQLYCIVIVDCYSYKLRLVQAAPDAVFSTAVTSLKPEDAYDPNRVKCVVDNHGYAIYFSRGLIPFNKLVFSI